MFNLNDKGQEFQNRYAFKIAEKLRLIYLAMGKNYNGYTGTNKFESTIYASHIFNLPEGMTMADACKVVSFLSDKVEREGLEPASLQSIRAVESILSDYGFVSGESATNSHKYAHKTSNDIHLPDVPEIDGVIDFITYDAEDKLFKKMKMSRRYFEWYHDGITKEEIEEIYNKVKGNNQDEIEM